MKALKHIGVGFLVSFIGSLPLGYLNIVGLEIYRSGIGPTAWYLLGVVSIEIFVIYFTLVFAAVLMQKKRLMRFIEGFTVVFLLALALVFYFGTSFRLNGGIGGHEIPQGYTNYVLGILLSCLNFLQIPFWTGWNLYLLNKKHIDARGSGKYFYVFGTAAGTFFGMLGFILSVNELALMFFAGGIMELVAFVFLLMGIIQGWKFYRKYYVGKK